MSNVIYGVTVNVFVDNKIVDSYLLYDFASSIENAIVIAKSYINSHGLQRVFKLEYRDDDLYSAVDLLNDDGSIAYNFVTTRKVLV